MEQAFQQLRDLVGVERSIRSTCQALHMGMVRLSAPAVGALHVTCADESEHECSVAFQQGFVEYALPSLKSSHKSPFRLANLGGRYEWGAIRIAEEHYATESSRAAWKLMVVKVNSHVATGWGAEGPKYGYMKRYGDTDACCGALNATLGGGVQPFVEPLTEALRSAHLDRVALLQDDTKVDPNHRALFAALASARLQARAVMLDLQDHRAASPTLYVVLPCVTINVPGPDTEILCGIYQADRRGDTPRDRYVGLGDDPTAYRVTEEHGSIVVSDEGSDAIRSARDHRNLVLSTWKARIPEHARRRGDERVARIRRDVTHGKHHHHEHSRALLKALLLVLAEITPVSTAMVLYGIGAAGIHHAFRAHRLAHESHSDADAKQILKEIHDRVDQLEPEQARVVLENLLEEHA